MSGQRENSVDREELLRQLQSFDSVPAELVEIFAEEAEDHLRSIYDGLSGLRTQSADRAALAQIRRSAHTLKGAAGAVNLQVVTGLSHRMEDLLDQLAERQAPVSKSRIELLFTVADQLQELIAADFDPHQVSDQLVEVYERLNAESDPAPSSAGNCAADRKADPIPATIDQHSGVRGQSPAVVAPSTESGKKYLRVPLGRLDDMNSLLGEMMVIRSEFQERLDDFERRLGDMNNALDRLRHVANRANLSRMLKRTSDGLHPPRATSRSQGNQFVQWPRKNHPLDFDPLEFEEFDEAYRLTQSLSEADHDARIVSDEFRKVKSTFESLLRRQGQLTREANRNLARIRMVPIAGILSRLERTVRTVSSKLGRQVELRIEGESLELDKTLIEEITDPLLHLIRNAIDHGIEDPDIRAAAGKPATAVVMLTAVNHGTWVTLKISDDGAGINSGDIWQKAVEQKLVDPARELSPDELFALIFQPGFSTAKQLTDVSGRGVGLDVVGDAVRQLNGSVRVDSELGIGTTFTLQLPTSIGSLRAVLVQAAGQRFALPLSAVSRVRARGSAEIQELPEGPGIVFPECQARLVELASHLGLRPFDPESVDESTPVLMLGTARDSVAVAVDSILGCRDVVLKPFGQHLEQLPGLIGATLDGNGGVIPILDTSELYQQRTGWIDISRQAEPAAAARKKLAMVVDDSISVRRVTANTLRYAGWEVVTATDGIDALEKLAELEWAPEVFLCDMEMPRMNGIELISQIRKQPEFERTPIVMVTSRATEKHRHRAFDAGATEYVVKPFDAEYLLERVTELVDSAQEFSV